MAYINEREGISLVEVREKVFGGNSVISDLKRTKRANMHFMTLNSDSRTRPGFVIIHISQRQCIYSS